MKKGFALIAICAFSLLQPGCLKVDNLDELAPELMGRWQWYQTDEWYPSELELIGTSSASFNYEVDINADGRITLWQNWEKEECYRINLVIGPVESSNNYLNEFGLQVVNLTLRGWDDGSPPFFYNDTLMVTQHFPYAREDDQLRYYNFFRRID